MSIIDHEDVDNVIVQAIIGKANELHVKEQTAFLEALSIAVGNAVGRALGG